MYSYGSACCNINGYNIVVTNGEVYVNGQHYVPEQGGQEPVGPRRASDKIAEREQALRPITAIQVGGTLQVQITIDPAVSQPRLKLIASENILDLIKVDDNYGRLAVSTEVYSYTLPKDVPVPRVEIVVPGGLQEYLCSGVCGIQLLGADTMELPLSMSIKGVCEFHAERYSATAPKIELKLSGAAKAYIGKLQTDNLSVDVHGTAQGNMEEVQAANVLLGAVGCGHIKLGGAAEQISMSCSGAGKIDAVTLTAQSGVAVASGAGHIHCHVNKLTLDTSGAAKVRNISM